MAESRELWRRPERCMCFLLPVDPTPRTIHRYNFGLHAIMVLNCCKHRRNYTTEQTVKKI